MGRGNNLLRYQHFITDGAMAAFRQAGCGAGGGNRRIGDPGVAGGGNLLIGGVITAGAGDISRPAGFRAGCCLCAVGDFIVAVGAGIRVVFAAHGVGGVEGLRGVGTVPGVVGEIIIGHQEPAVFRAAGIPGGIGIVILAVQRDDVPGVGAAIAGAGDHPAADAHLQAEPVQKARIALTYGGFVHQRGIGAVFETVGIIVQVGIIVNDVSGDVVVNRGELLIVRSGGRQLGQKLADSGIHLLLLRCGGVVYQLVGDLERSCGGGNIAAITVGGLLKVGTQIVALGGNAGMDHGLLNQIGQLGRECVLVILRGGNVQREYGTLPPGTHDCTKGTDHFGGTGIGILVREKGCRVELVRGGIHLIGIHGVDINAGAGNGLEGVRFLLLRLPENFRGGLHGGLRDGFFRGLRNSLLRCFRAVLADEGTGGLRGGFRIAAGIVMDMGAIQDLLHAAALFGADVAAGDFRRGLHIAAALGMYDLAVLVRLTLAAMAFHRGNIAAGVIVDMGALGDGLAAFFGVLMGAGTAIGCRGIAALLRVLRVVGAQPVLRRGKGRNRDIAQHQCQRQNNAEGSLEPVGFHLQDLHLQAILFIIPLYHRFYDCPAKTGHKCHHFPCKSPRY